MAADSSRSGAQVKESERRSLGSVENWVAKMRPSLGEIASINSLIRMLGMNARIEAVRAGVAGRSFALVAEELEKLSKRTALYADTLTRDVDDFLSDMGQVELAARGNRLSDMALSTIDILDRNLFERSCDVRWWATEAALWESCEDPGNPNKAHFASERLATILRSYTVYSDLVLLDRQGKILAAAGSATAPQVGCVVASSEWFTRAIALPDGSQFAVADVASEPLVGAPAPVYSAAVRTQGSDTGRAVGVLAIFFNWASQAGMILNGVRLDEQTRAQTRALFFNKDGMVIASSNGAGVLTESLRNLEGVRRALAGGKGFTVENRGKLIVAYAHTPGYETYRGLGWGCALLHST